MLRNFYFCRGRSPNDQACKIFAVFVSIVSIFAGLACVPADGALKATGAGFLKMGAGARAVAMGEAFSAVADDVTAIYWNPAGLALVKNETQIIASHLEHIQSVHHEFIGLCKPVPGGTAGFSATYMWVEGIEARNPNSGYAGRSVPVWDAAPALSFGGFLRSRLAAGLTLKAIGQCIDDKMAWGGALDAGILYRAGRSTRLGFVLQNLGYESAFISESAPLPLTARAGISHKWKPQNLLVACDTVYGINDQALWVGAGAEYRPWPAMAFRAGYKYNGTFSSVDLMNGASCGINVRIFSTDIDYAFVPFGLTFQTHRMSVIMHF